MVVWSATPAKNKSSRTGRSRITSRHWITFAQRKSWQACRKDRLRVWLLPRWEHGSVRIQWQGWAVNRLHELKATWQRRRWKSSSPKSRNCSRGFLQEPIKTTLTLRRSTICLKTSAYSSRAIWICAIWDQVYSCLLYTSDAADE